MRHNLFSLAGQSHGEDDPVMAIAWQTTRRACVPFLSKQYCDEIPEVGFVLRVDGIFGSWGFRGVERVRFNRKHGYIQCDIGVTHDDYKDQSLEHVTHLLLEWISEGYEKIAVLAKKKKFTFHIEQVREDLAKARGVLDERLASGEAERAEWRTW